MVLTRIKPGTLQLNTDWFSPFVSQFISTLSFNLLHHVTCLLKQNDVKHATNSSLLIYLLLIFSSFGP